MEARAVLTKFRDAGKEAVRQLTKLDKQHTADRERVNDKLGVLAEDVVDKLPDEALDADTDRAYALQHQIEDLAAELEEIYFAGSALEDLSGLLTDTTSEIYRALKETEVQLAKMERSGVKLGI